METRTAHEGLGAVKEDFEQVWLILIGLGGSGDDVVGFYVARGGRRHKKNAQKL